MRRPVGPQAAGSGRGLRIAPVRLPPAMYLTIHRRVVRVGDDDLMTQVFQTPCHPLALGSRLDQDARSGVRLEHGGEPFALGPDAPLDEFAVLLQDADLAHPSTEIYATIRHGWSSWVAPLSALNHLWGQSSHPVPIGDQPLHPISLARSLARSRGGLCANPLRMARLEIGAPRCGLPLCPVFLPPPPAPTIKPIPGYNVGHGARTSGRAQGPWGVAPAGGSRRGDAGCGPRRRRGFIDCGSR